MIRTSLLKLLGFYQRFLSLLGPGSCRYYPSCSEYARWEFEKNGILHAFVFSFLRILRCNQLFEGGIDYPKLDKDCHPMPSLCLPSNPLEVRDIKYWLVPNPNNHYLIVKNFDFKG